MRGKHGMPIIGALFLNCGMPNCQGFATTSANFVRHMKKKHGITIERIDVINLMRKRLAYRQPLPAPPSETQEGR